MTLSNIVDNLIGRLLGLEGTQQIEGYEPSLAAPWAHDGPAWLFFGCLGLVIVAVVFYARYQRHKPVGARVLLAVSRAVVLSLLLLLLAEPILSVTVTSRKRPALWLLFDGTNSMAIADESSEAQRTRLAEAVGLSKHEARMTNDEKTALTPSVRHSSFGLRHSLTRADYVKALLRKDEDNLLVSLAEDYRLRAFLFAGRKGVRSLDLSPDGRQALDPKHLAESLTTDGEVTALGTALGDLAGRATAGTLAAVVVFSDFDQNTGPAALPAANELGVPVYTVGVGATAAVDVAVGLQAPLILKKDEKATVSVSLRQQGLEQGESVDVTLRCVAADDPSGDPVTVGEKTVPLTGPSVDVDFPYVPDQTGRYVLVVEVEPADGEAIQENNRARREVTVRDDFLRLLFVEYEPTWEWRFIKEVFHRDKLVGMRGFRTFLRSSDPRVREANPMFLTTVIQPRSEFFKNDVIFLGDMPAAALSPRFCEMTEEFVRHFGGGLVVIAGPRFGPGQLAETPLAKLLPVKIDPGARISDREPFELRLAPAAAQYDFMQLGAGDQNNQQHIWGNLGLLPWYQPVKRLDPLATALAEHPTDTCVDKRTRQPLIAIRRYGRGEVIYIGFNETWRMRRKHGERYYRQFWGQMIHRLGLSHALGSQKRFVVRTDRRNYQAEDRVVLTVEAYDEDFQPLTEEKLAERISGPKLKAQLILPTAGENVQDLSAAQLDEGVFEARFPVYAGGEHRVRVTDPITGEPVEATFKVTSPAVERQSAVRNVALQQQIADQTGGRSYDLAGVAELAAQIRGMPKTETNTEVIALWHTWLSFGLVVALLLGEWLLRKRVNLP